MSIFNQGGQNAQESDQFQRVDGSGLNSVAANVGAMSASIDMALNNSSRFLYVHAAGVQTVEAFRVETDGSLTHINGAGGLPFGAQGIAAR